MEESNHISSEVLKSSKIQAIKQVLPEIIAAIAVSYLSFLVGICTAYSGIIIPQLSEAQQREDVNAINVTKTACVWFTSSMGLTMFFGSFISGIMTDSVGRIKVLQLSAIPHVMGWILLAVASNAWMLLLGRVITSFAAVLVVLPTMVYISETSSPKIRGALLTINAPFFNAGMLITYLKGWILSWRVIAWSAVAYSIISLIFILFIPESPLWLVSKNRFDEAQKSLRWFRRYQENGENEYYMEQVILEHIKSKDKTKNTTVKISHTFKELCKPSVYKPFMLLIILVAVEELSGVHLIMMNAVIFFEGIGTTFNPYLAAIYMSSMQFVVTTFQIFLMKRFPRRVLLMTSLLGMAICMIISGMCTKWIQDGTTTARWIPLCMLVLYFLFLPGVLTIPIAMASEIFPLQIRGFASNIVAGLLCLMLFAVVYGFYPICNLLGGLHGIQYFFGAVSLFGAIYTFIFVPETHNKDLSSIQNHFQHNITYISIFKCKARVTSAKINDL